MKKRLSWCYKRIEAEFPPVAQAMARMGRNGSAAAPVLSDQTALFPPYRATWPLNSRLYVPATPAEAGTPAPGDQDSKSGRDLRVTVDSSCNNARSSRVDGETVGSCLAKRR